MWLSLHTYSSLGLVYNLLVERDLIGDGRVVNVVDWRRFISGKFEKVDPIGMGFYSIGGALVLLVDGHCAFNDCIQAFSGGMIEKFIAKRLSPV